MEKIYVLTKHPGYTPRHVWVSNNLEALQKAVGGYIEAVTVATDFVILCDEEGRLKDKPHNCTICGVDFVGDIVICGVSGEDFSDLPCDWDTMKQLFPQLWTEPKKQEDQS